MSIVVVTGGRDYVYRSRVFAALDALHRARPIRLVLHGACPYGGADLFAEQWAKRREIDYLGMPARFSSEGKPGGPLRNRRMIAFAKWLAENYDNDLRLCFFPGGVGTADCKGVAVERGMELLDGESVALAKHAGAV